MIISVDCFLSRVWLIVADQLDIDRLEFRLGGALI